MRKENAAKEKEQKETARALEQIEAVRFPHFAFMLLMLPSSFFENNSSLNSTFAWLPQIKHITVSVMGA